MIPHSVRLVNPNQLIPSTTNAIPTQKRCHPISLGRQDERQHLSHNSIYASKEVARQYLQTRWVQPLTSKCFNKVDWEHLDLALQTKSDLYKIWRSKQTSGFCGTCVQVGRYTGQDSPDKRYPNSPCQETAAHLMRCPGKNRMQLLI
jgi:hypothetical protein